MDRIGGLPSGPSNLEDAKKSKKKKQSFNRTYRFNVSLDLANDGKTHYPDFNWLDLVAEDEESRIEAKRKEVLDPYASDDDEQLKALARKFEEKYGGATEKIKQKKKTRKLDDYADLGFGYDSNDPFIDNSDVHDEIVPENLTTAHGGFYVNCGPLEFKARESADEDSDVEAIVAESEMATKKRKYNKKKNNHVSSAEPPAKKKPKDITTSSPEIMIVSSTPSVSNSASATSQAKPIDPSLVSNGVPKKPRMRKEGSKPLGRPKKRNPDGTLVHPPKQPKRVDKIQSVSITPTTTVKPASNKTVVTSVNLPSSVTITTTTKPSPKPPTNQTSEALLKQQKALEEQKREEMLQKQLLEQVQEMQRRQEEYMREQREQQKKRNAELQKLEQKRLEEKQKAEAEQKRKKEQQKYIEQQKQQLLQQQQQLKQQEQQRMKLLKQQEEQKRLKEQQEKQQQILKQKQEEQQRLQKQREEQMRLQKQREEQLRLQKQREEQVRLQKQREEQQRLLKQHEEQQRRLKQQQQQEEQQRRLLEEQLKRQKEEQQRKLKEQEQQRKLKELEQQKKLKLQQEEAQRRLKLQQQEQKQKELMRKMEEDNRQKRLEEQKRQDQQRMLNIQRQQQQQQTSTQELLQRLQHSQPQSAYVSSGGYNNGGNVKSNASSSMSIQVVASNGNVGSATATQSQQQQRIQQYTTSPNASSKLVMQKTSPNASYGSTGGAMLTPQNASQMLASMQPQPPSALSSYYKQNSPNCQPQQQPKAKNPSPSAYAKSPGQQRTTGPQQASPQTSIHQPFLTATANVGHQSPQNKNQGYYTTSPVAVVASSSSIRLPTVPVPTTSMFSTISQSVISPAAVGTQNYLFTSLPQHSTQPNFDMSLLQTKPISSSPQQSRIPVSSSQDQNFHLNQFMNLPK